MWKHEQICNWNPANRACITCRHFTPRSYEERADCTAGEDIGEKARRLYENTKFEVIGAATGAVIGYVLWAGINLDSDLLPLMIVGEIG